MTKVSLTLLSPMMDHSRSGATLHITVLHQSLICSQACMSITRFSLIIVQNVQF